MMSQDDTNGSHPGDLPFDTANAAGQISKRFKQGFLDASLEQLVVRSWDQLPSLVSRPAHQSVDEIRLRAWCSEILDLRGRSADALEVLGGEGAAGALEEARRCVDSGDRNRAAVLVRYYVAHVVAHHYRKRDYRRAADLLDEARRFATGTLATAEGRPYYGLRGLITYYVARARRQLDQSAEALDHFATAIEMFEARYADRHSALDVLDDEAVLDASLFRRQYAVVSGLGVGWIQFNHGDLKKAVDTLRHARASILEFGDEYNRAFIELVYGSALRALAGSDKEKLKRALGYLDAAKNVFEREDGVRSQHHAYAARGWYEKAHGHMDLGEHKEAAYAARKVQTYVDKIDEGWLDAKWVVRSLAMRSRVHCAFDELPEAQEAAIDAVAALDDEMPPSVHAEAYLALCEAHTRQEDWAAAVSDAESALEVLRRTSSPRLEAVACLYLARLAVCQKRPDRAEEPWKRWQKLEGKVQHQSIHELAEAVAKEISPPDFIIPGDHEDLDYETLSRLLKDWLVNYAEHKNLSKSEASRTFNVSRPTYRGWVEKREERSGSEVPSLG